MASNPERERRIRECLTEVMRSHRDPKDADYNQCDDDPCMWCDNAQKVLDSAPSEQEAQDAEIVRLLEALRKAIAEGGRLLEESKALRDAQPQATKPDARSIYRADTPESREVWERIERAAKNAPAWAQRPNGSQSGEGRGRLVRIVNLDLPCAITVALAHETDPEVIQRFVRANDALPEIAAALSESQPAPQATKPDALEWMRNPGPCKRHGINGCLGCEERVPRSPSYLVIRRRETDPIEAYPFTDRGDALAFYDRAAERWTETYLCRVERGPFPPESQPASPAADTERQSSGPGEEASE